MTRTAFWLISLASLCAPAPAQDDAAPSRDPKARLKELQAEQRQVVLDWHAKAKAARDAAEAAKAAGTPAPAMPPPPDSSAVRGKYLAAAKEFAGDDAVGFLLPAFDLGETTDERREVLEILLTDHIASPQLRPLGRMLGYLDQMVDASYAATARERIGKGSKDPVLLGWLTLANHDKTLRGEPASSKAFATAKADVLAAVQKASDPQLRRAAENLIAEQEKFGIGMVAPDIVGVDLAGESFKLSDYKGKVVFLDFWGDW